MEQESLNPYTWLIKLGGVALIIAGGYFFYEHQLSASYDAGKTFAEKECDTKMDALKNNNTAAKSDVKGVAASAADSAASSTETHKQYVDKQPPQIKYVAIRCPIAASTPASAASVPAVPEFTDDFINDLNGLINSANQSRDLGASK